MRWEGQWQVACGKWQARRQEPVGRSVRALRAQASASPISGVRRSDLTPGTCPLTPSTCFSATYHFTVYRLLLRVPGFGRRVSVTDFPPPSPLPLPFALARALRLTYTAKTEEGMTVNLKLKPEVEAGLVAQAQASGMTVEEYVLF